MTVEVRQIIQWFTVSSKGRLGYPCHVHRKTFGNTSVRTKKSHTVRVFSPKLRIAHSNASRTVQSELVFQTFSSVDALSIVPSWRRFCKTVIAKVITWTCPIWSLISSKSLRKPGLHSSSDIKRLTFCCYYASVLPVFAKWNQSFEEFTRAFCGYL